MQMKLVFLPGVLMLLGLFACSDNDSGTSSMEDEGLALMSSNCIWAILTWAPIRNGVRPIQVSHPMSIRKA